MRESQWHSCIAIVSKMIYLLWTESLSISNYLIWHRVTVRLTRRSIPKYLSNPRSFHGIMAKLLWPVAQFTRKRFPPFVNARLFASARVSNCRSINYDLLHSSYDFIMTWNAVHNYGVIQQSSSTYPILVVFRSTLWMGLHISSLPSLFCLAARKETYTKYGKLKLLEIESKLKQNGKVLVFCISA